VHRSPRLGAGAHLAAASAAAFQLFSKACAALRGWRLGGGSRQPSRPIQVFKKERLSALTPALTLKTSFLTASGRASYEQRLRSAGPVKCFAFAGRANFGAACPLKPKAKREANFAQIEHIKFLSSEILRSRRRRRKNPDISSTLCSYPAKSREAGQGAEKFILPQITDKQHLKISSCRLQSTRGKLLSYFYTH